MSLRWTIEQLNAHQGKKKPSKSRNEKTVVDGIRFDSKKEAARYKDLKLMEKAGQLDFLILQQPFPVSIGPHKICDYIADFYYREKGGESVVEDCKGMRTPGV